MKQRNFSFMGCSNRLAVKLHTYIISEKYITNSLRKAISHKSYCKIDFEWWTFLRYCR